MSCAINDPPSSESSDRPINRILFPDFLLRVLTWVFYTAFIILWFKDNIDVLKKYRLSPLAAFIPLGIVVAVRLVRSLRRKPFALRLKFDTTVLAILLLLLVATVVRWPYLLNGERMVSSDDAVSALMGKHIAEGKLPPICYYGQRYLGSLSSHVYALFFLAFGYSIPVLKFATFLFYLGFIVVQFLLLKDVFSFSFAVVASLLYGLPFGQLLLVSLDNTSAYGLVLFLGAALIHTAHTIAVKKNLRRLPLLGFLMGLAFWTHQILASFILVALLILVFKAKLRFKHYGTLAIYGVFGGLPMLFQEVFSRFPMIEFLTSGEKGPGFAEKGRATIQNLKGLLAPAHGALGTGLLVFLLVGVAALIVLTARSKCRSGFWIFLLFLMSFGMTYWFSRFGDRMLARYLYPLYFCLPVLLVAPFYLIKSRLRVVLSAGLVALIVIIDGWPVHVSFAATEKKESAVLRQVVEAIRATGVRYWLADYWQAYALTAISKENIIVDTPWWNRYPAYSLAYYNQNDEDNYIFLNTPGLAEDFASLLTSLGVSFKRKIVENSSFFYAIGGRVFADLYYESPPPELADVTVGGAHEKDGYLEISFKPTQAGDHSRFGLNVEIPGYSEVTVPVPNEEQKFSVAIPAPPRKEFTVRYELNFRATKIPSTRREMTFRCAGSEPSPRTEPVVFLRGISLPVTRFNRIVRDCEREAVFEVQPPKGRETKLRLDLVNPFDFGDMKWYGRYEQTVKIAVGDGAPVEIPLREWRNTVEVRVGDAALGPGPVRVTMRFRYHFVFDYAANRRIAAFLENAEMIE